MRLTDGESFVVEADVVATFRSRWRGLMRRSPTPLLLSTRSVHGFWLRRAVNVVALDSDWSVIRVRRLQRRRVIYEPRARWMLELPIDHPLPRVGARLDGAFAGSPRHGRT